LRLNFGKNNASGIDPEGMRKFVRESHPVNRSKERYKLKEVCTLDTGMHCCRGTSEVSDIDKYGSGITLYFRFLKQITILFAILLISAIPSLYWYSTSKTYFVTF